MTDEEREEEQREILARFGLGIGDVLKKAKARREAETTIGKFLSLSSATLLITAYPESKQTHDTPVASPNPTSPEPSDKDPSRSESLMAVDSTPRPVTPPNRPKISTTDLSPVSPRPSARPSSPKSILSAPGTPRPSSRADRRLRFADVGPEDVHVFESTPSSPRRKALALPPPSSDDGPTISLGRWKGKADASQSATTSSNAPPRASLANANAERSMEEGTPEDIRRRFFPNVPANDPSLAWMESSGGAPDSSSLRLDLAGRPISRALSTSLPTHLGLHHHAEGEHAGYTLDDVFLLSRSTVPAQRAAMMSILQGLARRIAPSKHQTVPPEEMAELRGREDELRKRILAAGVAAMGERGSLGALAVEVVWICLVDWDRDLAGIEGVELQNVQFTTGGGSLTGAPGGPSETPKDIISTLPLGYVLDQITAAFGAAALPPESLAQLLAVVHRLAQHTNDIANIVVATPKLIANLLRTFLLTPIPPREGESLPQPFALDVLRILVSASRENAKALVEPTDALMRFIISVPTTSPFAAPLASELLAGTLKLYSALASYGFYAQVATTASSQLAQIGAHIADLAADDVSATELKRAWMDLLQRWMVCACDPHQTSPPHEILWSQIVGWGWGEDVLDLCSKLGSARSHWSLWSSVWNAEAAWLEGARVNSVRAGEKERSAAIHSVQPGFRDGTEFAVINGALDDLARILDFVVTDETITAERLSSLTDPAQVLASAIRLWLSCLPPSSSSPLPTPPFALPFLSLSQACAKLASSPLWSHVQSSRVEAWAWASCRLLSELLAIYLRLSRRLPDTSEDLWLAQAVAVLSRLLPGDEEVGRWAVNEMLSLTNADFVRAGNLPAYPSIWERGGTDVIFPFLEDMFRNLEGSIVAPLHSSPLTLRSSTTLRLPSPATLNPEKPRTTGLPLVRQWIFSPLDHLLKSGSSEVLGSVSSSWDASETEVVRVTLLFAKVTQSVLARHGLVAFLMTREEVVFGCMKIFMLEHEQPHNDSGEEVFRDSIVGQLMDSLLAPFTLEVTFSSNANLTPMLSVDAPLEAAAKVFLGPATPFFQYYTDFVALYDAISFSHPTFARLLLPPLSMRYPVDYRKHLWHDFAHVLRTIHTDLRSAITGDVSEYLWPIEADFQIIGAYLGALIKGAVSEGFLRFVAVHHLACNIWPDLLESSDASHAPEGRGQKLLHALIDQGGLQAVREVVTYRQIRGGQPLLPPACFAEHSSSDWRGRRLNYLAELDDPRLRERLSALLTDTAPV